MPRCDAVRQAVIDIARREFGAVITGQDASPLDGLRAAFAAGRRAISASTASRMR